MAIETALDWLRRSSSLRKRNRHQYDDDDDDEISDKDDGDTSATATAWRFLRYGKSGIAPLDAAWKQCRHDDRRRRSRGDHRYQHLQLHTHTRNGIQKHLSPPPVVVLEGPQDVGKTWMLLSLAARFVVETRASIFDNDDEENRNPVKDRPKVLFFDSNYDFTISQLVYIVHQRLRIVRQREEKKIANNRNSGDIDVQKNYEMQQRDHPQCQHQPFDQIQLEEEYERQEKERLFIERDLEDCLSRIHIIHVDDGSTGWIPILEAMTHRLKQDYTGGSRNETDNSSFPSSPPTLLLWDGFLSDIITANNTILVNSNNGGSNIDIMNNSSSSMAHEIALFDSPVSRELLRQVYRLLESERDTLWLVLTVRTSPAVPPTHRAATAFHASNSMKYFGIGFRVAEWIRKEEERRTQQQEEEQSQKVRLQQQHQQQNRTGFVQQNQTHQHHKGSQRTTYRIQLDRNSSRYPNFFARILSGNTNNNSNTCAGMLDSSNRNRINGVYDKIPYSLSLEGILS